jgi:hypothetical protein
MGTKCVLVDLSDDVVAVVHDGGAAWVAARCTAIGITDAKMSWPDAAAALDEALREAIGLNLGTITEDDLDQAEA